MRIITLGRVAGIGEGDDHFYEGSGYLLRFSIDSADEFFAMQLPFIVATLGIDVRQIMRLELLGDGYSGLRQAMLCISFEDPTSEGERPENALAKLSASPSTPPSNSFTDDILRERLIRFFLLAPNVVRARFLKDSDRTMQDKGVKEKLWRETHVAGCLYRVSYDAGSPPSIAEWRNTLLYCSEALRRDFSAERLERITFTAIPNSEEDYKVEAELLLPKRPRIYKVRSELRFRSRSTKTVSSVLSFTPQTGRPEQKLKQPERHALDKFDGLDTRERLRLWNKHLSKFYQ